jgi:hypothetical protein
MATHDIMGAFNNTNPEVIIQIMELQKMPAYLTRWVRGFTTDRSLAFSFYGKIEKAKHFGGAIPQGSLVSLALFSIAISAIIEMSCSNDENETFVKGIVGFIVCVVISKTYAIWEGIILNFDDVQKACGTRGYEAKKQVYNN